jgi:hypothetical protein
MIRIKSVIYGHISPIHIYRRFIYITDSYIPNMNDYHETSEELSNYQGNINICRDHNKQHLNTYLCLRTNITVTSKLISNQWCYWRHVNELAKNFYGPSLKKYDPQLFADDKEMFFDWFDFMLAYDIAQFELDSKNESFIFSFINSTGNRFDFHKLARQEPDEQFKFYLVSYQLEDQRPVSYINLLRKSNEKMEFKDSILGFMYFNKKLHKKYDNQKFKETVVHTFSID